MPLRTYFDCHIKINYPLKLSLCHLGKEHLKLLFGHVRAWTKFQWKGKLHNLITSRSTDVMGLWQFAVFLFRRLKLS